VLASIDSRRWSRSEESSPSAVSNELRLCNSMDARVTAGSTPGGTSRRMLARPSSRPSAGDGGGHGITASRLTEAALDKVR
jgi:hypothetical protein